MTYRVLIHTAVDDGVMDEIEQIDAFHADDLEHAAYIVAEERMASYPARVLAVSVMDEHGNEWVVDRPQHVPAATLDGSPSLENGGTAQAVPEHKALWYVDLVCDLSGNPTPGSSDGHPGPWQESNLEAAIKAVQEALDNGAYDGQPSDDEIDDGTWEPTYYVHLEERDGDDEPTGNAALVERSSRWVVRTSGRHDRDCLETLGDCWDQSTGSPVEYETRREAVDALAWLMSDEELDGQEGPDREIVEI